MIQFRTATQDHLPVIVHLLAQDALGTSREKDIHPLPQAYIDAFNRMKQQVGNSIIVALDQEQVIACLQLTIIHGISRFGTSRAQIEGVRVDRNYRGQRIGEALIRYAIEEAKQAGCTMMQLTTDKQREDAHRFYERLGFVASHDGMKLFWND